MLDAHELADHAGRCLRESFVEGIRSLGGEVPDGFVETRGDQTRISGALGELPKQHADESAEGVAAA